MRHAHDQSVLENDKGEIYALNLGWFSAEELKAWADGVAGNKIDKVEKPVKMKV